MPRKERLPQVEVEICNRLRVFREALKIARTVFARTIGIPAESLASYESARAPVRYELFRAIYEHFSINPRWLAGDEYAPMTVERKLEGTMAPKQLNRRELFSSIYEVREYAKTTPDGRALAFNCAPVHPPPETNADSADQVREITQWIDSSGSWEIRNKKQALESLKLKQGELDDLTHTIIITTLLFEEMSEGQLLVCMRKVLTHNGLSEPLKLHWVKVLGEWAMIKLKLAAGQMVEHPKATPPKEL